MVVDASVIIKWFIPEVGSPEAGSILIDHLFGREELFVPELLYYQVVNVLRYKSDIESAAVEEFIDILSKFELKRVGSDAAFFKSVLRTARQYDISAYDAAYVALASLFNCTLVTADTKLAQKTGKAVKFRLIVS